MFALQKKNFKSIVRAQVTKFHSAKADMDKGYDTLR